MNSTRQNDRQTYLRNALFSWIVLGLVFVQLSCGGGGGASDELTVDQEVYSPVGFEVDTLYGKSALISFRQPDGDVVVTSVVLDEEDYQSIEEEYDDPYYYGNYDKKSDKYYERALISAKSDTFPIRRVAISSTTHIPFLKAINADFRLVAIGWAGDVQDENIEYRVNQGEILDLTNGTSLDVERLVESEATVLFCDPAETELAERAADLGILVIPVSEHRESHPVARAAWINAFGAIFGREKMAKKELDEIRKRYTYTANRMRNQKDKPKVLMGSVYQGKWYAPGGESLAAAWINDAGADYVLSAEKGSENVTLDMEKIMTLGPEIDLIGHVSHGLLDVNEITQGDKRIEELPAIAEGSFFHCNSEDSDYFGQAILEPHLILTDLAFVFHPKKMVGHRAKYFYRHQP